MVARAAELARDSHARTRHSAVLVKEGSLLAWGNNGVPFPGEDHCYCKFGELGWSRQPTRRSLPYQPSSRGYAASTGSWRTLARQ
jgi:hypothetical protein